MSGQIRRNLGRDRAVARRHCDEYVSSIAAYPAPWDFNAQAIFDGILVKLRKDVKKLEKSWSDWMAYIDGMDEDDDDAVAAADAERVLFNDWKNDEEYITIEDDLDSYIARIESYAKVPCTVTATRNSSIATSTEEETNFTPIKLSSLNIPKFSGDYAEWTAFWNLFDIFVHQQKKYPDISKFAALRSLLEGRALAVIQGITTSAENYATVVKILKERFGNQQFIVRELESKLKSIQPAKNNPASIGTTVNAVTNLVRQLQNLGIDTNNNIMMNTVIEKMPFKEQKDLQLLLFDEPDTSIDDILLKMERMEMKAELVAKIAHPSTSYQPYSSMQQRKPQFDRSNTNWRDQKESTPRAKNFTCAFCDGDHRANACSTYASAEERIQQLRRLKRCTKCMGKDHLVDSCPRTFLKCNICQGPHYALLCNKKKDQGHTKSYLSVNRCQSSLLIKKAVAVSNFDGKTQQANLFFDCGSQRSYIINDLVDSLDLPKVNQEMLNVEGFAGMKSVYCSDLIQLRVKTVDGYTDIFANSTKKIADGIPYLKMVKGNAFDRCIAVPDILIGMDYFGKFITSTKEVEDGIYAYDSIVGRMYAGKVPLDNQSTVSSIALDQSTQNVPNEVEKFWKLETMGIVDSSVPSQEDQIAHEKIISSIEFKDKRYFVSWPFKAVIPSLPSNAGLAIARLRSTLKKLNQDPDLIQQYQAIIDDQIKRGTIEIAPRIPQGKVVHYLPHHAVLTPQKATTKVRMVFDGSAKVSKDKPSLNNCLYRGPIEMPEIPGLLFRLRVAKILLTGDIEKAFHQIYLIEADRDAVRFFWVKDPSKPAEGDNLIVLRFIGITFGVITSPAILAAIIKYILQHYPDPKLLQLLNSIYVDNIFVLEDDPEAAIHMFQLVRDCFLGASMNVREWLSNDSNVLDSIPEGIKQASTTAKILGLEWDSVKDSLSIDLKNDFAPAQWTKRNVLKLIASAYDPLGFLSPVTIKGRIFMQKLFQEDLKWDDGLSSSLVKEWKEILKLWNGSIDVPRQLISSKFPNADRIEMHIFADASKHAYCAAVYLRIPEGDGYRTPLIFAKTRLQPLKKNLTIPKMEVMGIWLAAKIGSYVAKEMNLDRSSKFIWTDSQISFYWFKKWPKEVFVANRLKEVLEADATVLFVPGALNPADLGTRGITMDELRNVDCWWNGPEFLKHPRDKWPKSPEFAADLSQTVLALVSISETELTIKFQAADVDRCYPIDADLSWNEQKMKVARQLKGSDEIQPEDLDTAEKKLIIQEQEIFVKSMDIKQMKLVKDEDGIYRTRCRFDHAELLNAEPILIPKKSSIARMICLDAHTKLQHAGVPHTLSKLREKYWIPSGRATVSKCIKKCPECKYWRSKPFSLPNMPKLPASRINRSKPFENVGVDYCGPFKVKGKEEKAWIILFTCFSTRLLHLELVTSMSAEDFLLSFRKFVARCGAPKYVLSDNAKQFKTAATALDEIWKKAIKDEASIDYFLKNSITWDFITERAPWKGGLYERLVALVKNSLKFSVGKKAINIFEFSALLCEIEATLNSRPLTYVHADDPFVIRPADFIYPSIDLQMPCAEFDAESSDPTYMPSNAAGGERLVEKYLKSLKLVDCFWKRWSKDYLNLLRERNNDQHQNARGAVQRNPLIGEYVLVSEADMPRGCWKVAKIVDCCQSSDQKVRSAEIEYLNGFKTRRAINHLYPLEESAANLDISDNNYPFVIAEQSHL